jgi:hypothetical protein
MRPGCTARVVQFRNGEPGISYDSIKISIIATL